MDLGEQASQPIFFDVTGDTFVDDKLLHGRVQLRSEISYA